MIVLHGNVWPRSRVPAADAVSRRRSDDRVVSQYRFTDHACALGSTLRPTDTARSTPCLTGERWWDAWWRPSTSSRWRRYQSYDSQNISALENRGAQSSSRLVRSRSKYISRPYINEW